MRQRVKRHIALATATGICFVVAALRGSAAGSTDRLSIVSAYICLALLCWALSVGPMRAVTTGRPIINAYLRRDLGIWAALTGLVHFVLANLLSMNDGYLDTYVNFASFPPSAEIRSQLYNMGTIAGFVVAVLFLLLLALSSDRMIRVVGIRWWKRLQRASYLTFIFTSAHAFAFQILEAREWLLIAVVIIASVAVLTAQIFGIVAVRRQFNVSEFMMTPGNTDT